MDVVWYVDCRIAISDDGRMSIVGGRPMVCLHENVDVDPDMDDIIEIYHKYPDGDDWLVSIGRRSNMISVNENRRDIVSMEP